MKNDERKGEMEDEETSSFNILHSYFREFSVGPACRAGLRGLPRPECMRTAGIGLLSHWHVPQVRLAAKVLSGRKDLP